MKKKKKIDPIQESMISLVTTMRNLTATDINDDKAIKAAIKNSKEAVRQANKRIRELKGK